MQGRLRRVLIVVMVTAAALAGAVAVLQGWPRIAGERVELAMTFDPAGIGPDIDAWLAAREAAIPDITPGTEKRVVWAGPPGAPTDLAIIYVHGFSATSEEIRPVPDRVAEALGANLFFTRLAGHGRPGPALAAASVDDWVADMDEALAIGRRIGRRVMVIATSTGGTLAALALADRSRREGVAGVVFVSPNFGLAAPASRILHWPGVGWWGPLLAGRERSFAVRNPAHGRYWTTRYPTVALLPMAALTRAAGRVDYGQIDIPALFIFSDADRVVSAEATRQVARAWGGPVRLAPVHPGPDDDPDAHVITGDILSPGQTEPAVELILDWAGSLR